MQEGSGSTLAALVGTAGTYTGSPTLSNAGPVPSLSKCATFNGSSQTATAAVSLSAYSSITLTFWLWWDTFANNDKMALACPAPYSGSGIRGFVINPNSSSSTSRFEAAMSEPTGSFRNRVFTRPTTGAWHHYGVRLVRNGAASFASFIVDGAVPPGDAAGASTANMTSTFTGTVLNIMSYGGSYYGAGRMAGLALFPTALTDARIIAQRNAA